MGAEAAITDEEQLRALPDDVVLQMLERVRLVKDEHRYNRLAYWFPETGPVARHLYPRHLEFFGAGKDFRERCFMAGNRVGKTIAGGYEFTCHATGLYPDWWEGRRFDPVVDGALRLWAAGDTNETTRDVIQKELFGQITYAGNLKTVDGTGMIPRDRIILDEISWKAGVPDLIDVAKVRHTSGSISLVGLKSYGQGRKAFQGTAQHVIWCDEEPDLSVYNEMLVRTMTTQGLTMLTYTPLEGLTDTVLTFLPAEFQPGEA